jgi:molybdopterin-guanine dinucleotide biosynthesis protein A
MNVVVLAGGKLRSDDPLAERVASGGNKAHLVLAGKPMLQWVLDALGGSELISKVILVGQNEQAGFTCIKPIFFLQDQGSLVENILVGVKRSMQISPEETYTLVASGDSPLVTTEMVDWVIQKGEGSGADLLYHVISEDVMETRFPGANRTFVPLKGVKVCGGDLNMIANAAVEKHKYLWARLAETRKSPFKQAAIFGPVILGGVVLRLFTLENLSDQLSQKLGMCARAVLCPYAELGMDIDKLHQFELVQGEMEKG